MVNHIPRADWEHHPRFPQQALIMGSHGAFRTVSEFLAKDALDHWAKAPSTGPRPQHRQLFESWMGAMKAHESFESRKLFPYLNARFGVETASLELQHTGLGMAADRVREAFDQGDALLVAHQLRSFRDLVTTHLDREEERIVPLLLNLPPGEFAEFEKAESQHELRDLLLHAKGALN